MLSTVEVFAASMRSKSCPAAKLLLSVHQRLCYRRLLCSMLLQILADTLAHAQAGSIM